MADCLMDSALKGGIFYSYFSFGSSSMWQYRGGDSAIDNLEIVESRLEKLVAMELKEE